MFFSFPPEGPWSAERQAAEFSASIGASEGAVRVGRRVIQALLSYAPTPERCVEAYHFHRAQLELIAERPRTGSRDYRPGSARARAWNLCAGGRHGQVCLMKAARWALHQAEVFACEDRHSSGKLSRLDQIRERLDANCGARVRREDMR